MSKKNPMRDGHRMRLFVETYLKSLHVMSPAALIPVNPEDEARRAVRSFDEFFPETPVDNKEAAK